MELYNNKYKVCTSLTVFVATSREMKGTYRRLNLIKMTCVLHGCQKHQKGRDIYRHLLALVELQKSAYAEESERSLRMILRRYNQSFIFANLYSVNQRKAEKDQLLACLFMLFLTIFPICYG